ncbi:MAG: MgtC/SapB family protein [Mariprofundaceae bacterium]|nr:MgtC/SapB family protein [Mariprofundaceae bacterium]
MDAQLDLLIQAMAALGIGLLIGLEREYGQRRVNGRKKHVEAAGIRTFALVALAGNLLTWLPQPMMTWGVSLGLGFTALIALLSYRRTSMGEQADKGITSEVVLVLTFILGTLTGLGYVLMATIVAVIVFTLLHFKKILHHFSHSLSRTDMRQAIQFLIVSVVVLPVLPNKAYGPYESLNPQHIWLMVVLISGIGFAGYAAIKVMGQRVGLGITGMLGGLASSTAVTLSMSRLSHSNPAMGNACILAIILACGTMFPRVAVLSLLFNPEITSVLLLPVLVITGYALLVAWLLWRRGGKKQHDSSHYQPEMNPLSMRIALAFGAFYGLVVFFSHMAQFHFGDGGILTVAGLSGLSDIDAITLSVSEMSREHLSISLAAQAILLACATNSIVKLGMGLIFAAPSTRGWLVLGLLPMALLSLAAIGLL